MSKQEVSELVALQESEIRVVRHRLGLSQKSFARVLDVSARSVSRWERTGTAPVDPDTSRRLALAIEILTLSEEVHGADVASFLATPRRSLGTRSPRGAMVDGDLEGVRQLLVDGLEGHWA